MIKIRTSDRIQYRRCRRKWDIHSHLRQNLQVISPITPLWFGTGIHYAVEDYHGYNSYKHPYTAFQAFVRAWKDAGLEAPPEQPELLELASGMLNHYLKWLDTRGEFTTVWTDGKPLIEVDVRIPISNVPQQIQDLLGDDVVEYSAHFDRMVHDEYNRLWIMDFKTRASFNTGHLDLDPQVTSYVWAAQQLYKKPVEGLVYVQMKKLVPKPARILRNGTISTATNQATTGYMYREGLMKLYGSVSKAPAGNKTCLNDILAREGINADGFIRRDMVRRNANHINAEPAKIWAEMKEMLDPNLQIYPNPTPDCAWDCSAKTVCLAMEEAADVQGLLDMTYRTPEEEPTEWRNHLPKPHLLLQ